MTAAKKLEQPVDYAQQLNQFIADSTQKMLAQGFGASDFIAQPWSGLLPDSQFVALLDYHCESIWGSMAISAHADFILKSHQTFVGQQNSNLDQKAQIDWLNELGNMLLGEFKAILLSRGVNIQFSYPFSTNERDLILAHTFESPKRTQMWASKTYGEFYLHFMYETLPGFKLYEEDDSMKLDIDIGEILLF